MEFLGEVLLAVATGILTSQIYDSSDKIARTVLKFAVKLLPARDQERYSEEWLSHLQECESKLGKVWHALGCVRASGSGYAKWSIDVLARYLTTLFVERALWIALWFRNLAVWIAPEINDEEVERHRAALLAQIDAVSSIRRQWFRINVR